MDYPSESELSSLPSDYDDSTDDEIEEKISAPPPSTSKRKSMVPRSPSAKTKRNPFLPPPRTCTYSAWSLHGLMIDQTLDLNPDYQRDIVWNDLKQGNLIDSIMHNYYIPPVVFATKMSDDGYIFRVCIDGKQRLTSILRFMDGEIPYKDSINGRKSWYKDEPGSRRKLIADSDRKRFDGAQITCVEYNDISEDQEREIFQRVQMGVSLTCAERLAAINGPHARIVREIQDYLNSPKGFSKFLDWGHARNKDFQIVAQVVYLIGLTEQKIKNKDRKAKTFDVSPGRLGPFLGRKTLITDTVEASSWSSFEIFCQIVQNEELRDTIRADERLTPLEFVTASYLIFKYHSKMSFAQLAEAIHHLRLSIAKFTQDKRFNVASLKHALDFIKIRVPKLKLASDNNGDSPAYQPAPAAKGKRKRFLQEESNVDSTSDAPVKRVKKAPATTSPTRRRRAAVANDSNSDDDDAASIRKTVPRPPLSASRATVKAGLSTLAAGKTSVKRTLSTTSVTGSVKTGGSQGTAKKPASLGSTLKSQMQVARPSKKLSPSLKIQTSPKISDATPPATSFPKKSARHSPSEMQTVSTAPSKSEIGIHDVHQAQLQVSKDNTLNHGLQAPHASGSAPPAIAVPKRESIPPTPVSATPAPTSYHTSSSQPALGVRPDRLASLRSVREKYSANLSGYNSSAGNATSEPVSSRPSENAPSAQWKPTAKKFPDFKRTGSAQSAPPAAPEPPYAKNAAIHMENLEQILKLPNTPQSTSQSSGTQKAPPSNGRQTAPVAASSQNPARSHLQLPPTPGYTPTNPSGPRPTTNGSQGHIRNTSHPATPIMPSNTNRYFFDQQIAGQKRPRSPSCHDRPVGEPNNKDSQQHAAASTEHPIGVRRPAGFTNNR